MFKRIVSTLLLFSLLVINPSVYATEVRMVADTPYAAADRFLLFIDDMGFVQLAEVGRKPVRIQGIENANAVYTSGSHHAVLTQDGQVFLWGDNRYGQLGVPGEVAYEMPTLLVIPGETIVEIALGTTHTLLLTAGGDVYAVGANDQGQLGIGPDHQSIQPMVLENGVTMPYVATPVRVAGIYGAWGIRAGHFTSFVLMDDGTVRSFGRNLHGMAGATMGGAASHILREDGVYYTKGYACLYAPTIVRREDNSILYDVHDVACGDGDALFLLGDGTVLSAHPNGGGYQSDASLPERMTPVIGLKGVTTGLQAGNNSLYIFGENGETWAWGHDGLLGVLANPQGKAVLVAYNDLRFIAAGMDTMWGLDSRGRLQCVYVQYEKSGRIQQSNVSATLAASARRVVPAFLESRKYKRMETVQVLYAGQEVAYEHLQVLLRNAQGEAVSTVFVEGDYREENDSLFVDILLANEYQAQCVIDNIEIERNGYIVHLVQKDSLNSIEVCAESGESGKPVGNASVLASQFLGGRMVALDGMDTITDSEGLALVVADATVPVLLSIGQATEDEELPVLAHQTVDVANTSRVTLKTTPVSNMISCTLHVNTPSLPGKISTTPTMDQFDGLILKAYDKKSGRQINALQDRTSLWLDPERVTAGQEVVIEASGDPFSNPATTLVKLDENRSADANITITQLGAIAVYPRHTDGTTQHFITLFTQKGKEVSRLQGTDTFHAFYNLAEGDYIVALSALAQPGKDVLRDTPEDVTLLEATVFNGQAVSLRDACVQPIVDYVSGIDTTFSTSQTYAASGDHVTLSLSVQAHEEVHIQRVMIEVPPHTEFIDSNVSGHWMHFSEKAKNAVLSGGDLIIFDGFSTSARVWFDVRVDNRLHEGTADARMVSRAFITYLRNNVEVTEELDPIEIIRQSITLNVPRNAVDDVIIVYGEAAPGAEVIIYSGLVPVAQTTASADGVYAAEVSLFYDGMYSLWAQDANSPETQTGRKVVQKGLSNTWVQSVIIEDNRGNSSRLDGVSSALSRVQLLLTPESIHTVRTKFGGLTQHVQSATIEFYRGDTVTHSLPLVHDPSSDEWVLTTRLSDCGTLYEQTVGSSVRILYEASPDAYLPEGMTLVSSKAEEDGVSLVFRQGEDDPNLRQRLTYTWLDAFDPSDGSWETIGNDDMLCYVENGTRDARFDENDVVFNHRGVFLTENFPEGEAQSGYLLLELETRFYALDLYKEYILQLIESGELTAMASVKIASNGGISISEAILKASGVQTHREVNELLGTASTLYGVFDLAKQFVATGSVSVVDATSFLTSIGLGTASSPVTDYASALNNIDTSKLSALDRAELTEKLARDSGALSALEALHTAGIVASTALPSGWIQSVVEVATKLLEVGSEAANKLQFDTVKRHIEYLGFFEDIASLVTYPSYGTGGEGANGGDLGIVGSNTCPEGFVYEAVFSNTLQGVDVTIACMDNPLLVTMISEDVSQRTASDGRFHWLVPEGYWQLTFSKAGYVQQQSDIMHIPPERTDIAIGLVSTQHPDVAWHRWDQNGLELMFTQYMQVDALAKCLQTAEGRTAQVTALDAETGAVDPTILLARHFRIEYPVNNTTAGRNISISELPSYTGITLTCVLYEQEQ